MLISYEVACECKTSKELANFARTMHFACSFSLIYFVDLG